MWKISLILDYLSILPFFLRTFPFKSYKLGSQCWLQIYMLFKFCNLFTKLFSLGILIWYNIVFHNQKQKSSHLSQLNPYGNCPRAIFCHGGILKPHGCKERHFFLSTTNSDIQCLVVTKATIFRMIFLKRSVVYLFLQKWIKELSFY